MSDKSKPIQGIKVQLLPLGVFGVEEFMAAFPDGSTKHINNEGQERQTSEGL